ncbi:extracellular mutant protein 11-domain-containing protein [Ampelomyces quisqualis]|uniref:Extracellular mutant protein 11-domain-containing protein n=1 Tax=Ampelomyces quisqualis TaxID=50730 RepID=A0A6A5QCD7_AMPQU|nr:extracellular mutant protein 11-domain-containing protein [Ampelomyces quisqualis]
MAGSMYERSKLQKFVEGRERAASPQHARNGPPVNPERRAIGANAKVTIKRGGGTQQPHQPQAVSGLPSRGLGNVQNNSAAMQHVPQRRHSGPGHKLDPYDTDAESLDTTINQSVIQPEDSQIKNPQHQQKNVIVDLRSEGTGDGDEESGDDEDGEEDAAEYGVDDDGLVFEQEHVDFLKARGQDDLDRLEAAKFLSQNFPAGFRLEAADFLSQNLPAGFRTVDGDSYPSTTDGHPTERGGVPQPTSEDFGNGDPLSPSSRHPSLYGQQSFGPPMNRIARNGGRDQQGNATQKIIQQSAHLRHEQRSSVRLHQHPRQELFAISAPGQSSQSPPHSQVKQELEVIQPVGTQAHLNHAAFAQPQEPHSQPSYGSVIAATHSTKEFEAPITFNRPSPSRNQALPVIQYPHAASGEPAKRVQPVPLQNPDVRIDGDYELESLYAMNFEALKKESFDNDPRAPTQPLSKEMVQKPLIERLIHVQQNLDAGKQSDFFRSLPTNEWEDAGDWFLEQFSSIIKRTKEARQTKRKLAQGFEDEVEKRYKHVSKKQNQVQEAMSKMQAQGEGLVPRSPRTSKSPKSRMR